jgi:Ser/Thr protein kinase RdoA (MazF antagonist)
MVADLDPGRLRVSLPGFHDPARRLALLETAATDDLHGRATEAGSEVEALVDLRSLAELGRQLASAPTRVAHNDAKAANLLVDERGAAPPVVVDLDTVMPGTILWDVGDMVRSATGTAEEDAGGGGAGTTFDAERHHALIDAWLDEVGDLLTASERDLLPVAGPVITYEQAVRFLADHLMGDLYFRVARPGQNLDRARNQLALLRSMMAARAEDVGR